MEEELILDRPYWFAVAVALVDVQVDVEIGRMMEEGSEVCGREVTCRSKPFGGVVVVEYFVGDLSGEGGGRLYLTEEDWSVGIFN